jgi:hypothetical protein
MELEVHQTDEKVNVYVQPLQAELHVHDNTFLIDIADTVNDEAVQRECRGGVLAHTGVAASLTSTLRNVAGEALALCSKYVEATNDINAVRLCSSILGRSTHNQRGMQTVIGASVLQLT